MQDNTNSFNNKPLRFSSSSTINQSTFLIKGDNPHFKISNLFNDFEQDELAMQEFIEVAIIDLTALKIEISNAFLQKEVAIYKKAHYRTLTTLKMIQANTLQDLLVQSGELLERSENALEEAVFRNLEKEFSTVLTLLNALNPR